MTTYRALLLSLCILVFSLGVHAQTKKTRTMTGSAAKAGSAANLKVAPDLDKRLAKFRRVRMPFNAVSSDRANVDHHLAHGT